MMIIHNHMVNRLPIGTSGSGRKEAKIPDPWRLQVSTRIYCILSHPSPNSSFITNSWLYLRHASFSYAWMCIDTLLQEISCTSPRHIVSYIFIPFLTCAYLFISQAAGKQCRLPSSTACLSLILDGLPLDEVHHF